MVTRDCQAGDAVQIEPVLRSQSPKNGNFSNIRQRLSPISLGNRPNRSLETNRQFTKARHWRAFLALPSVKSPVAGLPGWRRSADSHPSPRRFPANREFYREFCDFEGYESRFRSKKPLCSSHFSSNSTTRFCPSINPNDRSSSMAATIVVASRDGKDRTPIRYFRPASCAHTAMGSSVAAAPPRSVMNSRRCMAATKLRRPHRHDSNEHLDRG
jgi:hypothetical protein